MKYSIEQSEITERTEQINKFALLVDLFNKKAVDRETFMAELSKIEQTDWAKENLFNQLIGYCVLGDTCAILFCTQNMTNKVSIGGTETSGAREKTALLGAQNRYAIRLADYQRSSPSCAGWTAWE